MDRLMTTKLDEFLDGILARSERRLRERVIVKVRVAVQAELDDFERRLVQVLDDRAAHLIKLIEAARHDAEAESPQP